MAKFRILVATVVSCLACSWSLAQDATNRVTSENPWSEKQLPDIDRARIESEKARLAARNGTGSRIPYQIQMAPAPSSSLAPAIIVQPPVFSMPPPTPTVIAPCDQGGCFDAAGNRYNGGSANTYLNSAGKPCVKVGSAMQCF